MSFDDSKQVPMGTNFVEKNPQNLTKAKKFNLYQSNRWLKIMFCLMSAVEWVGVKI